MASSTHPSRIFIGCAGWSLPRAVQAEFDAGDSHLQRYASRFNAAEINSSFYRPHKPAVYERWATSVPAHFRFAVKLPKTITHEARLVNTTSLLDAFLAQVTALGPRLGCLLVQLPPSLAFEAKAAGTFLKQLRDRYEGGVALEPRHATWFNAPAEALLHSLKVGRVLADPVRFEAGRAPGGWPDLIYVRPHGSPRMYYSSYDRDTLDKLSKRLNEAAGSARVVWCMFDNTASGAATDNALYVHRALVNDNHL